jgi:hypothetical protein
MRSFSRNLKVILSKKKDLTCSALIDGRALRGGTAADAMGTAPGVLRSVDVGVGSNADRQLARSGFTPSRIAH